MESKDENDAMTTASLKNVSKVFPEHVAVDDISLEVADGGFVVLVGPSGCGKSTTLRMVAGLEQATSGDILIGDKRVNDVSPRNRDVAMVFQNYALYPHLSVYENLAYALRRRRVPRAEIDARVIQAARSIDLEGLLKRRPAQLSGGQRQRVALGRAIVRQPKLFLMDEPLSNLDAKLRVQTRSEITRLQKELGVTTLYVTHDQAEAMTMGTKIVVMNNGKIQQVASPRDLYDRPANIFVAEFMGTPPMNLITCHLDNTSKDLVLVRDGVNIACGSELSNVLPRATNGASVIVGFRPEDVTLVQDGSSADIYGQVQTIEELGHETLVMVNNAGTRFTIRLSPNDAALFQLGDKLSLSLIKPKLRFFDAHSGASISLHTAHLNVGR